MASVHYGKDYDNAFFDGRLMVFGDGDDEVFTGFTGSLSIIGHELSHGVISHTADLEYFGQPGALNEHCADVFGALTQQHDAGQNAEDADWLIGAGIFTPDVTGRALRSMIEPGTAYDDDVLGKDPQPAHMDDFVTTDSDNGGVHLNSGIPNRAFALAAIAVGGPAWESVGTGLVLGPHRGRDHAAHRIRGVRRTHHRRGGRPVRSRIRRSRCDRVRVGSRGHLPLRFGTRKPGEQLVNDTPVGDSRDAGDNGSLWPAGRAVRTSARRTVRRDRRDAARLGRRHRRELSAG